MSFNKIWFKFLLAHWQARKCYIFSLHVFFISDTLISNARLILAKIKQKLSKTLFWISAIWNVIMFSIHVFIWFLVVSEKSGRAYTFSYKQLGSGLSPQSCLYLQGFWGPKLLNGCLVVWPSNLCLRRI